jgi:hypothetical protein
MIQRDFTGKAYLPGLGSIDTGKVFLYPIGELAGTIPLGMIVRVEKAYNITGSEVVPVEGSDEKITAPQWYNVRVEVDNVRDAVEFDAYVTDEDAGPISLQELYISSTVGGNPGPRIVYVGDDINRLTFGATEETPDGYGLVYNAVTGLLELRELATGGGGGVGDMLEAEYDTDGDGKVNAAELADVATEALHASTADSADEATHALTATTADTATLAANATNAVHATTSDTSAVALLVTWANVSGKPLATSLVDGLMSSLDKVKLDGIAPGATANSTDPVLKDRANHTGTQVAATISDLSTAIETAVKALLNAGANVTLDETTPGSITISAAVSLPGNVVVTDGAAQTIQKPVTLDGVANNLYKIVLPSTTGTKGFQITAPDGVTEVLSFSWNSSLGGYPTISLGASPSLEGLTVKSGQYWQGAVMQLNGPIIESPSYSFMGIRASAADLLVRPAFGNGGSLALGAYWSGAIPAIVVAYSYFSDTIPFAVVGGSSGTVDLVSVLKNPTSPGNATGATLVLGVSKDGAIYFGSNQVAEGDAPNNSLFVSSTGGNAGKLVFKNSAGVVSVL